uniref:Uncharacterized protein n=1 Tax=Chlamydia pneumoniae TaxID=83558 RepID=A0A0F7WQI4_CHLPN|nr:hypothetical protein BN1224_DC9_BQ_00140 [Chlamydia pneumoniae]
MPHKLGIHKIIKLNKYDLNVCFIANFYFSKKKIFVFFLQLKKTKKCYTPALEYRMGTLG